MTKQKLEIMYTEDLEGLYIDGKLIKESPRIMPADILKALNIKCDIVQVDQNWFKKSGLCGFPEFKTELRISK